MDQVAIAVRPCSGEDLPLVGAWQARPHVARWWGESTDRAAVEAK